LPDDLNDADRTGDAGILDRTLTGKHLSENFSGQTNDFEI